MSTPKFSIEEFLSNPINKCASDNYSLFNYLNSFEKITLWGAGRLGTDICACLKIHGVKLHSIWDKNAAANEEIFRVPIFQPYTNTKFEKNQLIIVCVGGEDGVLIQQELKTNGFENFLDGKKLLDSIRNPYNDEIQGNVFNRFKNNDIFQYQTTDGKILSRRQNANNKIFIITDLDVQNIILPDNSKFIENLDELSDEEIRGELFYVYFQIDSDALPVLKRINSAGGKFIPHIDPLWRKNNYRFINKYANLSMRKTWNKNARLSHLIPVVHENICEALELTKDIHGEYVEIGVYLGGSAYTALNYLDLANPLNKSVWLIDTFSGFNYYEAFNSADALWADTHGLMGVQETICFIKETLSDTKTKFELIEANICRKALPEMIQAISVANIDVDMYEPTLAALNKVSNLIKKGGIIICEDPASTPGTYGAFLAMHEFLDSNYGERFKAIFKRGQYFLFATS